MTHKCLMSYKHSMKTTFCTVRGRPTFGRNRK